MFAAHLAWVAVSGPQVPGLHMVGHGGGVRAVERTLVASPAAVNLPHHQLSDGLRQIWEYKFYADERTNVIVGIGL